MGDFECREADSQILDDLEPFREGGINITNLYERGAEMFPRVSFIHYSIVDSKVRVCVCVCTFMCVYMYIHMYMCVLG